MKVILARCSDLHEADARARSEALAEALQTAGLKTEFLELPSFGEGIDALATLASHRLLNLRASCDALICLDLFAAVLRHPRKFAMILEEVPGPAPADSSAESLYLFNALRAGLQEARSLGTPRRKGSRGRAKSAGVFDLTPLLEELAK